jgi:dipeptidyl aminopeptidase/acylaminoacyl peptidase
LQPAPGGNVLYALRTTMERPAEVVKIDVPTGAITALTDQNGAAYKQLELPVIDAEWFAATDGKKIHAWIVKPPGFDPTKKYPFLLYCQGGPQSMVGQGFSFRWNFHLMAAQGYVVAGVNRRGLPGFGQEWTDQISRDWGGQAMQDLLSVCDSMQQRPYVDKARSAAVGASFGGYTVYWLMGNAGDRFACMISHCGVFNLESMYLATEEQFFVDWDLGGPYWASPEIAEDYRRFSPHRYVQNWKTPLLVIHGARDYRVPYDQGLQAFSAAQLQGVPSRLLVFPDEGHWVLKPQNGVLWQREFFAWLDRFCGGGR